MKLINFELSEIADGGLQEKLNAAIEKVVKNVNDPNTDASQKRKINIAITLKPSVNRESADVLIEVKETLAPQVGIATTVLLGQTDKGQSVLNELKSGVQGQEYFDPEDSTLKTDIGKKVEEVEKNAEPIDFKKAQQSKLN